MAFQGTATGFGGTFKVQILMWEGSARNASWVITEYHPRVLLVAFMRGTEVGSV